MNTIIEYKKTTLKVSFEQIKNSHCFYSNGVLYMRILQQDLDAYKINNVNAISILAGGLTFFDLDEIVTEAIKEQITK